MNKYAVTLGLGRMANHHKRTIEVFAEDQGRAVAGARQIFYADLHKEIGKDAPILGKVLVIEDVKIALHVL